MLNHRTPAETQNTPRGYVSPPIRLDPADRILSRSECWRSDCRAAHRGYATIASTSLGRVMAWCHRRVHDDLGYRADRWKCGAEVAA